MDKRIEDTYLEELAYRCRLALRAFNNFRSAFSSLNSGDRANFAVNLEHMWLSLHAFLTQQANVSKLLWPVKKKAQPRGQHLRTVLNVSDDSPLHDRTLRDKLDHFDERLDDWVAQSKTGNLATWNVFPPGALSGIDVHDIVGDLDPINMKMTILGTDYEIMPLVEAIARLLTQVDSRLAIPFFSMPPDSHTSV